VNQRDSLGLVNMPCVLCEAAVRAEHLSVDPSTIGPSKERHDICDIVRLTEAFEWCHAADLLDLFFSLAVQEELGTYRSGRDGVDSDLVSAKLVGENMDEAFDTRLGGDIGAIGGEIFWRGRYWRRR
jgi:hypothetical protein